MPASVQVELGAGVAARAPAMGDAPALRRLLARAVRAALRHENVTDAEVSVTLMDDAGITDLNRRFLGDDGPTDVIAFPLYAAGESPVGDIYIGYDQAVQQARAAGVPVPEELVRLSVHGTLHVLGYDHPAGDDRVDSGMWSVQEALVSRIMRAGA
jgi:probable rRNA maturation factor